MRVCSSLVAAFLGAARNVDPARWFKQRGMRMPRTCGNRANLAMVAIDESDPLAPVRVVAVHELHALGLITTDNATISANMFAPEGQRTTPLGAEFLRFINEAPET